MTFAEVLNSFLETYAIKASDLAEASGLSGASISRFRNGKREPSVTDGTVDQIAAALAKLSGGSAREEDIRKALISSISGSMIDREKVVRNLNALIDALDLNAADLARAIGYDPSHLSKIRTGARKPGNGTEFCESVSTYVAGQVNERNIATVAHLIGISPQDLATAAACRSALFEWLASGAAHEEDAVEHFLYQLDEFDLNEYLKAVNFDGIKVPKAPFNLPKNKDYYTVAGCREAELAWGRSTILSKKMDDVFMYNDMPIEEAAQDEQFAKQWMMGLAMMLKKGLRINIIHDLNRPLHEMMLGLEGWIPLYMTGQVSPYYLKGYKANIFNRFLRVSGSAALQGDSIEGSHARSKYHLTSNKDELAFYESYAADLLEKATPLMEIYSEGEEAEYERRLAHMCEGGKQLRLLELGQGAFSNMVLESIEGECVIITKTNLPVMHFVIRHPKLMHAIENLTVPIVG